FKVFRDGARLLNSQPVSRCINQAAIRYHGRGLRQPGWIPERLDFAFRLEARASAAVETIKGRCLQKKSFHHLKIKNRAGLNSRANALRRPCLLASRIILRDRSSRITRHL